MPPSNFSVEVNPAVLRWARETAGQTTDQIAQKLGLSRQTIGEWETGKRPPTWKALRKLSHVYQRPLAALLLAEPPQGPDRPPDFRTLPTAKKELSPRTLLAIRTARWLQSRAIELHEELRVDSKFTRKKLDLTQDAEIAAERCRATIGIDLAEQTRWSSVGEAYRRWKESLGEHGVFVFQFSFPRDEVQGFSLFDLDCPAIVVNETDAMQARIFTLFHEYAHLLLREPGICLPQRSFNASGAKIEPFCNRFSAAFLIPEAEARSWKISLAGSSSTTDAGIRELARTYHVSKFVVLIRLKSIGRISEETFAQVFARWRSQDESRTLQLKKPGSGGPSAIQISERQRGKHFISLVLEARRRGLVTTHDATTYLGVKAKDLRNLELRM